MNTIATAHSEPRTKIARFWGGLNRDNTRGSFLRRVGGSALLSQSPAAWKFPVPTISTAYPQPAGKAHEFAVRFRNKDLRLTKTLRLG